MLFLVQERNPSARWVIAGVSDGAQTIAKSFRRVVAFDLK